MSKVDILRVVSLAMVSALGNAAVLGCSSTDAQEGTQELPGMGTACRQGLPGPELILVTANSGAYCIDAHEVKQRHYAEFLSSVSSGAPAQPPECTWNVRFEPIPVVNNDWASSPDTCPAGIFDPSLRGEFGMSCVDWCDARAYCEWAGKRLCGGIGALQQTLENRTDPTVSEWQHACTNGGTTLYPYGNDYIAGKCVDANFPPSDPLGDSQGSPECAGTAPPFNRIFDLAGNLEEWTAACDEEWWCALEGSGFGEPPAACADGGRMHMGLLGPSAGFRCCADPQ